MQAMPPVLTAPTWPAMNSHLKEKSELMAKIRGEQRNHYEKQMPDPNIHVGGARERKERLEAEVTKSLMEHPLGTMVAKDERQGLREDLAANTTRGRELTNNLASMEELKSSLSVPDPQKPGLENRKP